MTWELIVAALWGSRWVRYALLLLAVAVGLSGYNWIENRQIAAAAQEKMRIEIQRKADTDAKKADAARAEAERLRLEQAEKFEADRSKAPPTDFLGRPKPPVQRVRGVFERSGPGD